MNKGQVRLIFVRHGEPEASGKDKFAAGLTEKGKEEASITGDFLAIMDRSIERVFASNLERATQTAEIISKHVKAPLEKIPDLQEIHLGEWEGKEPDEIRREAPELVESFMLTPEEFQIPGGEKLSIFLKRSKNALRSILSKLGSGTGVVVAHRLCLAFMICELLGKDYREFTNYMPSKYCGISCFVQKRPFQWEQEFFDMKPSGTISHAKKTTDENLAFFGFSFAIALACFWYAIQGIHVGYRSPRTLCLGIWLSSYIRYMIKYWDMWLRIPPITRPHNHLNWAIMIVGSATAILSFNSWVFCFAWGLVYILVSVKEYIAVSENRNLFHVSLVIAELQRKSRLAILKAFIFFAVGLVIMVFGNIFLWHGTTIEVILLYVIFLWTIYALLIRDLLTA